LEKITWTQESEADNLEKDIRICTIREDMSSNCTTAEVMILTADRNAAKDKQ